MGTQYVSNPDPWEDWEQTKQQVRNSPATQISPESVEAEINAPKPTYKKTHRKPRFELLLTAQDRQMLEEVTQHTGHTYSESLRHALRVYHKLVHHNAQGGHFFYRDPRGRIHPLFVLA